MKRLIHHPIVVQDIVKGIVTVWQGANVLSHQKKRALSEGLKSHQHHILGVIHEQGVKAFDPQIKCCELGIQVAPQTVGQSRIGSQNRQHILLQLATFDDANRWDLHRLLPTLSGPGVVVAWHRAAHIVPMRGRRQIAKQNPILEVRPHQLEVVGVGAAFIGVIEEPGVAGLHPPALKSHCGGGAHRKGHHPDKNRQARFALHQGVPIHRIIKTVAGIVGFGNDGVERTAVQGGIHLIGNLLETSSQNGQGHRIQHLGGLI